jgi:hypothetical protein
MRKKAMKNLKREINVYIIGHKEPIMRKQVSNSARAYEAVQEAMHQGCFVYLGESFVYYPPHSILHITYFPEDEQERKGAQDE